MMSGSECLCVRLRCRQAHRPGTAAPTSFWLSVSIGFAFQSVYALLRKAWFAPPSVDDLLEAADARAHVHARPLPLLRRLGVIARADRPRSAVNTG